MLSETHRPARGSLLITGGSRGIGAALVRSAVREGYRVCFTYAQRADEAHQLVENLREHGAAVNCLQADVGDIDSLPEVYDQVRQRLGTIDALVNNAGITGPLGPFVDTTVDTMRRVLDVNVLGTMVLCQLVVRDWIKEDCAGRIVNVSSVAATLGSPGEYIHYAAAKAAVDGFTIGLGKEVAGAGIRVNAVSPGTTLTDIHAAAGEPDRPARVTSRIPMQRPGEPNEIAQAILWLLSDKASYTTASIMRVGGGL